MDIRLTELKDWTLLKQIRLAALLDMPTAFAVSYKTASQYSDQQWEERASSVGTEFWLAFEKDRPIGMVGAVVRSASRYELIGMWVERDVRGSTAAARLVGMVKARAIEKGFDRVFLEVSPDNARASNFYLKHGFVFLGEWEHLDSHPHIMLQTMLWISN